ncbi:MAG: DNA primase [Candidatus Parcubacteria bacterium]|nr:MAG: DNA primase [Candidatus Parcubacteria bacterium]
MNLEEIKSQLDIIDVVGKYVKLRRVGKYYSGLCPFHKETKPSFYVSPELQIFKCFGCGESGDVFKFLMKIEDLNFNQALEKIKSDYGLEISFPTEPKLNKKILEINYASLKFFRLQLKQNKEVLNYLKKRGLTEETIDKFELGFSPGNVLLRDYLYANGYDYDLIKRAGLLDSKNFDRFQSRIIFPLRDENGRLVGFTGRNLSENNPGPKYLNSPETELFKKSHFLYGLYYAKDYISQFKKVILVEGQFDFLLAWQNNYRYVVAVSGSALTPFHLKKLKKFTSKIVFAFDNDSAGFSASLKANLMARNLNFNTFQLKYQSKDLADLFASKEEKKIEEEKFENYLLNFLFAQYGIENKERILEIFLPQLKNLKPLEAEEYLEKLSQQLNINKETLLKEINNLPDVNFSTEKQEIQFIEEKNLEEKFSLRLISLVYAFDKENNREQLNELKSILPAKFNNLLEKVLTNNLNPEENEYLEMTKNFYLATNLNLNKELTKTLTILKTIILKNKLKKLNDELKLSKPEESDKIIKLIQSISQQLKELAKNGQKI